MEFRLLGPLEVLRDGQVLAFAGAKQRALLALLLLRANEVVSRDLLLEELWADRPPGTAGHSLDVQISRLRRTLEPDEPLSTRQTGYLLKADREQVDVFRFERLLGEGRSANAAGRHADALDLLGRALALWRGQALADFTYERFARPEIERLEDLRLAATEERVEAELALGRHEAIVSDLESHASRHPLRERLRGQLMLALYRSGRQAEALRVYAETRRRFSQELGLEPGHALRELEQAILRQDPSLDLAAAPAPKRRRRRALAAVALLLVAGAAAAVLLLAQGGTQNSPAATLAQPNSVALLDSSSGKLIGQAEQDAALLTRFGAGALWSLSYTGILEKVDPETGKTLAPPVNVGFESPCGLAVGEGAVWVTDCNTPSVVRVDASDGVITGHFRLPVPPARPYLASKTQEPEVGAGSVWVGQGQDNPSFVYRLDPRSGHMQKRIVIPTGGAEALAFGDGALWVAGGIIGHLSRIDPQTNKVTTPIQPDLGKWLGNLTIGGGFVWAATTPANKLWKYSEDGTLLDSIRLAAPVEDLTYADGAVWASAGSAGTVVRIDPTTDVTRTYPVGHHVIGVDARQGILAVSVQPTGQDATAGLKGRIAHVALKVDNLDPTDPAVANTAFDPQQTEFHYATCAKLFNYPDASGNKGKQLLPEVAAAWPRVSDGGRTYTFRIRTGYRFSPPSNEAVTADTFRHTIERTLAPTLGAYSPAWATDVVGATTYAAGAAQHISGISARGDALVIRVVKPAPDLPEQLAQPRFCAVPLTTPPVLVQTPIPSAGPYYLATRADNIVVLKRNPNYHGPRPHELDAIVYRMGVDVPRAEALIANGEVDYVAEDDPALAPNTAAVRAAGPRYRRTANNWMAGFQLNTRRPLFADVRMRRAVAYAIDRRTLADVWGIPTSHVLAPSAPDYRAGPTYPPSPGLRIARRLAGGRHVQAVYAVVTDASGKLFPEDVPFIRALREQLGAIGIRVRVLRFPQTYYDQPSKLAKVLADADFTRMEGNAAQTHDPLEYLSSQAYLPASARPRLGQIANFSGARRELEAVALAAELEREAVFIGYGESATPEFVSKRLGCLVDQPEYPGLDLAALCLRDSNG